MHEYRATIKRVLDGDTVDVVVDLGFGITSTQRLQLAQLRADNLNDEEPEKRTRAQKAKSRLEELLPKGSDIFVITTKNRTGKGGKWQAVFRTKPDGSGFIVNAVLLRELLVEGIKEQAE